MRAARPRAGFREHSRKNPAPLERWDRVERRPGRLPGVLGQPHRTWRPDLAQPAGLHDRGTREVPSRKLGFPHL